ncbi:Ribosomal-protein-S18p-alanine acetyltransferase [Rhodovulum sp. PH10]|nr:Ribosomal-protein-S18p-alanine acetyltransferase [Rhodovulum sp. PH10]
MIDLMRKWLTREDARIGEGRPGDAPALAVLHAASFRRGWSEEEFERLLAERNVIVDLATLGDDLAGFVMSRQALDEAEILSVAVSPARRGRRVASRLLSVHLGRLTGYGVAKVFLEVDRDNQPACRLYRAAGFSQVGERPGYYDRGDGTPAVALVMRKDLL